MRSDLSRFNLTVNVIPCVIRLLLVRVRVPFSMTWWPSDSLSLIINLPYRVVGPCRLSISVSISILQDSCKILIYSRFCYSSFLGISLVLTWNMILFQAKYHFKKSCIYRDYIFVKRFPILSNLDDLFIW